MATETTTTSAKAWAPDLTTFAPQDVIPEALILTVSTVAGNVEGDEPAVRVAYVDDASATFVAEADEIPESDPALSEVLVHTAKVSQLVRLSREQWTQAGTSGMLSESVRRAVTKAGNTAFLAQAAPTSPAVAPAAGLLNVAGIEDGGAIDGDLDGLIDLVATIAGNGGEATHILLAPTAWASLRKFKTATGSAQTLLGAGTNDATKTLLDLPVIVSNAVPENSGLVVDRTAVVSAVGSVQVATSSDVYFSSDSIGLRCTWRFGHNIVRPERLGKFTVTSPTA